MPAVVASGESQVNIALQVAVEALVADIGLQELLLAQRIMAAWRIFTLLNGGISQFMRNTYWFEVRLVMSVHALVLLEHRQRGRS